MTVTKNLMKSFAKYMGLSIECDEVLVTNISGMNLIMDGLIMQRKGKRIYKKRIHELLHNPTIMAFLDRGWIKVEGI